MIQFSCPHCGSSHSIPKDKVPEQGASGTCNHCGQKIFLTRDGVRSAPPSSRSSTPKMFSFTCPHCGVAHAAPPDKIPPGGIWGTCNRCSRRFFLTGKGAFATGPTTEADGATYTLHTQDGKPLKLDRDGIVARIKAGRIYPWDQVAIGDGAVHQIQEMEKFREYFETFMIPHHRHCVNHRDKVAVQKCDQCGRGYCGQCHTEKKIGLKSVSTCPACWGVLKPADLRWLEKPFYRDVNRLFLYPVVNMAWATTLGIGLLQWLGKAFIPLSLVFYVIAIAYIVHIVSISANGKKEMGVGPDYSDLGDLLGRGFAGIVVSIAIWAPIIAINVIILFKLLMMGPTGFFLILLANIPLLAAGFIYYPMALGMVAVWDNKWIAFRPDIVLNHILKIKKDYIAILAALIITSILSFVPSLILRFFPIFGKMVASMIGAYFQVMWCHALGWTLYLNEKRLGWD